ncbi:hypothetical protein BDZ90DRAFT_69552 [Jaminaea rosea]|uniref:Uncharacterized protein n=1 Tax=Jaminaea rosea TaxID=1569628 RepID=A0A316UK08_9BASI|nr:hypothetical protein BDZ90DRAFT_69552 [Jaminaea rosea]PWN25606.1 hypothetical protein BDZ90DRAFT_69552 [Jaminaea rosea]
MSSLLKRRSAKSASPSSRTRSVTPFEEQPQVTSSRSTGFLSSLRPRSAEASPGAKDTGRSFSWSQTYARVDPNEFRDKQDDIGGGTETRLLPHNATPAFASSGRFGSFSGIVDKDTTSLHSIEDLALHRPAPHQTSEGDDAAPEIAPRRSSIASTRPPPVEVTIEVSKEQLNHSRHASVESTLEEQGFRFNATPSPPALPSAPNGTGPHHPYVFRLTPPSGERGEATYLSEYATVDGDEDVREVLMHPRFGPSDAGELGIARVLYAALADLLRSPSRRRPRSRNHPLHNCLRQISVRMVPQTNARHSRTMAPRRHAPRRFQQLGTQSLRQGRARVNGYDPCLPHRDGLSVRFTQREHLCSPSSGGAHGRGRLAADAERFGKEE